MKKFMKGYILGIATGFSLAALALQIFILLAK